MQPGPVKTAPPPGAADDLSRRDLLKVAAAAYCGLTAASHADEAPTTASAPATVPSATPPWWLRSDARHSRVIDIRSKIVVRTTIVDRTELGSMLDRGLQALTDESSPERAWRSILGNSKRIVLKFNSVAAQVLQTNDTFARVLVGRLTDAGYEREMIALVEAPPALATELGTRDVTHEWGSTIPLGTQFEQLASWLLEADAIINVPFLKSHLIAGMSGAMKNLAYAAIRRPARYHDNGCAPYVGDIIRSEPVAGRLKLSIVNALRIVVDRGPEAEERDVSEHGGLLLGYDPLATDTIGWGILTQARRKAGLRDLGEVAYLTAAAQSFAGRSRSAEINRVFISE